MPDAGNAVFFFVNDTATPEIYTLSLHVALPIYTYRAARVLEDDANDGNHCSPFLLVTDRKSTRLNSSHVNTSYAVFCLKKKTDGRTQLRGSFWASAQSACHIGAEGS